MLNFIIDPIDSTCITISKPKLSYDMKELESIKENLSKAKTNLDKLDRKKLGQVLYSFDKYTPLKKSIENKFKIPVTNATLKFIELWNRYVDPLLFTDKKELIHFDNASFPGTFIIGASLMMNKLYPTCKYTWYASSLLPSKEASALEDRYHLYEKFPSHWLMNKEHNGDLTDPNMQLYIKEVLGNKVDLYTSDAGMTAEDDYNNQETVQMKVNVGQILSGLITLRKGGIMITKQYTFFEPLTVSLIALLTTMFKTVEISKPQTSRTANSEVYIVCSSYYGLTDFVYKLLIDRLSNWNTNPLITKTCIGSEYIKRIRVVLERIYNVQITELNSVIQHYNSNTQRYTNQQKKDFCRSWYMKNINIISKK